MKTTSPVCACEYQFTDEGPTDLTERLKEMLDIDVTINDLDATPEIPAESGEKNVPTGRIHKVALCVLGYILHFTSFSIVITLIQSLNSKEFLRTQVQSKSVCEVLIFQFYLLIGYTIKTFVFCIYYFANIFYFISRFSNILN